MPAIRDLKGRPVDELVDSRTPPALALPEPGREDVERDAIRQAVRKVQEMRGHEPDEEGDMLAPTVESGLTYAVAGTGGGGGAVTGNVSVFNRIPLPADMEEGLRELESSLDAMLERMALMRQQVAAIRARAEKDATKLGRLAELLKQMGE